MVISTLRIAPPRKRHLDVLEILRSVVGPSEVQPGCLGCHLYEEEGPDHATVLSAQWSTEAALQDHIRSEIYRRILAASELSDRPPEFRFHWVSETRELEWVHQLRRSPGCDATP